MYEKKHFSLILKFLKNYGKYVNQASFYPEKEHNRNWKLPKSC